MPSVRRNRKYHGDSAANVWPADHQNEHAPKTKKNTRKWCKGKVGIEHVPVIVLRDDQNRGYEQRCHVGKTWWHYNDRNWWCNHQRRCGVCTKILDYYLPSAECPDFPRQQELQP